MKLYHLLLSAVWYIVFGLAIVCLYVLAFRPDLIIAGRK